MSEYYKKKRMTRLIGFGALIVFPLVFILSFLFNEISMNSNLSIFLIVLITSAVIFGYYLLFIALEKKILEKKETKDDPFNR